MVARGLQERSTQMTSLHMCRAHFITWIGLGLQSRNLHLQP